MPPSPRGAESAGARPDGRGVDTSAQAEVATTDQGALAHPPLDVADLRDRWPRIQAQIAATRLDRSWFHQCALLGVDGQTLLLRLDQSLRPFVEGRDRRMTLERELGRVLERPVSVRLADETDVVAPAGAPSSDGTATEDPVVRAGLRLFGGPLRLLDAPVELEDAPVEPEDAPVELEPPSHPEPHGAAAGLAADEPEVRQWW